MLVNISGQSQVYVCDVVRVLCVCVGSIVLSTVSGLPPNDVEMYTKIKDVLCSM